MRNRLLTTLFIMCLTIPIMIGCTDSSSPDSEPIAVNDSPGEIPAKADDNEYNLQCIYEVGSTTIFIHDKTRPFDSVAGVNTGVRTLITEIWYPVEPSDINKDSMHPTYGDYVFGDFHVHDLMMTDTTFYHLTPESVGEGVTQEQIDNAITELFYRERESYLNVPLAENTSPFPVIIMSHGDAGSRYNMETVCESLAGNGYIVIAPEHTGNSPFSMIGKDPALDSENGDPEFIHAMENILPLLDDHGVYGADATNGQTYMAFERIDFLAVDTALIERLNDLRATLDELEAMNRSGRFKGAIDLDRIGLMGRSFGGSTTLVGLELEERFKAGVAVVPPSLPDIRCLIPSILSPKEGEESAFLAPDREPAIMALNKPTLIMNCKEDTTIISLNLLAAIFTLSPIPSPANSHPALWEAFEKSDAPVVWTMLSDANHGSYSVSGPYFWPELKPNTFQKFFNPFSQYTLIDSQLAHDIQTTKIKAFFDVILKDTDESSFERLISQEFMQSGLELDFRNF